ncbi:MAG: 16S rRNA (cytosine(1402)-N(4))-methyltransferase RsmH [bacterium]|nr:16S rRNA (cytosine(1402)-N(4))-methyltransferase RsmH [bacterium]
MNDPVGHTPVLTQAVSELLAVGPDDVVVDATVGSAGHATLLGQSLSSAGTLLGLDVDPDSLARARDRLAGLPATILLQQENFRRLPEALAAAGLGRVDVILADLGVSSAQLADPHRGLSFSADGPLDMRLDPRLPTSAADLVNRLREEELADLIYHNGQERLSRRIARRICSARRQRRITRTAELVEVICRSLGVDPDSRRSKIHPATRTFQALRIAVNDELGALDALLAAGPRLLKSGGRLAVISFHSLEDGRVKRDFRARRIEGTYEVLTKKPVVADPAERKANPRSRSAKLRVAVRTERECDTR